MAGALVPLIATVAPEIISLIAGLVHKHAPVVEAANGPSSGPVKFADLFGTVIGALTNAANVGTISKVLPSDDTVKIVMQAVVTSMKMMGLLNGVVTDAAVGGQSIVLKAGQTITIGVAV